ncbi:hypothetical protein FOZ61_004456 [Perkinsus olseni]|uniref:AB hydrolase-1 domain-containing protein n=1 Tax=Perkinsus olseni TaxID=32597 RepID=A0A7J6LKN7_PEROL|nr:hypothetical protein FOZ61_004456 [Perkinsus olseni]
MSSTTSIGSGTTLRPTTPFDASDFYWLHLRGETTSCQATSRFLLLHGWLQDQTAWGQLPRRLLEHYGGEVILLDFFGMGRSPDPPEVRDLTPDLLLQQVECCARKANWLDDDSNRKIVVAGMSLGGGIGLRFASRHVHLIERIVLVAPSALPDTRTLSVVHWAGRGFTERIGLGAPPRLLNPAESIFKPIVSAVGRTAKLLDRGRRRGLLHRIACNANLVHL